METKTTLSFCTLIVRDNILISEINEGVIINKKKSDEIIYFASVAFNKNPFMYITNRVYSYSVNPFVYKKVSKIKNLIGFAVVSKTVAAKSAEIERLFLNKPFEIFSDLDIAINWGKAILNQNKTFVSTPKV